MRSLRITFRTKKPITLPLAYNQYVHGLIYSCWRDRYPNVHDNGRGHIGKYVFGRLTGRHETDKKAKTIRYFDFLNLEVRTPFEELLDELAAQMASRGRAHLKGYELDLVNLQCNDRLIFPQRATILLTSPVVEYRTTQDGHTTPISPLDADWLPLIQANTAHKAKELGLSYDTPLQAMALTETIRKQVTTFKGTHITGWTGKLMLSADPRILGMLWTWGLGVNNCQGFGMFDILDE